MAKIKALILYSVIFAIIISCGGSPTGSSGAAKFEGVPEGEIVPVEKRDSVLTGVTLTESQNKITNMTQKWWLQKVSKIDYTGCEGYEDEDITLDDTYFAFTIDGSLYVKQGENGSKQYVTGWSWTDDSKSAIVLDKNPEVEFEITSLNEEEVVYASLQSQEGCEVLTWEQFGEPIAEEEEVVEEEENSGSLVLNNTLEHDPYRSIYYAGNYEFANEPKFPSNKVLLQDVPLGTDEPTPYKLTIGSSIDGESEIEIFFDELVEGRTYYLGDANSKYEMVDVKYKNTVRDFDDGYVLEYMQEVLENPSLEFYNIENKGMIKVVQWDKENRKIMLTFSSVHLVYFALCSEDCSVTSPTYDGGWQYETDFVNMSGTILVQYDDRLL